MTGSVALPRGFRPVWDSVLALGLLCTAPSAAIALFMAGWSSVPAHRAYPDGATPPMVGPVEVALNHLPLAIILVAAAVSVAVRWQGRARTAALVAWLQIGALALLFV